MFLSLNECEKDILKEEHFVNTGKIMVVVVMGYIPCCPPEPPTPGYSCGPEYQQYSWKTGKGWQMCGAFLPCRGRWGPGSSLHEGQCCSSHPSYKQRQ